MKLVAFGWAALFFACAAVQWNDPDPMRWVVIYTGAATACVMSVRSPLPRGALFAIAAVSG